MIRTAYQERLRNLLDQGDSVVRLPIRPEHYVLPVRHPSECTCSECDCMGQRYADYLKNRDLWGNGGLE